MERGELKWPSSRSSASRERAVERERDRGRQREKERERERERESEREEEKYLPVELTNTPFRSFIGCHPLVSCSSRPFSIYRTNAPQYTIYIRALRYRQLCSFTNIAAALITCKIYATRAGKESRVKGGIIAGL